MTEQNAALAFDRALDGERGISLNGSESLVLTAHAMQTLFDRQQEIPTEEFVMQLEQTLLGLPVVPSIAGRPVPAEGLPAHTVVPTGVEGSPAGAVSRPHPTPRPAPIHPKRTRTFPRWAAIAAALILLFGGAGAITLGPFDLHSTPDPSAIPAIGFGTVEASPEPVGALWTVSPPQGVQGSSGPAFIEDGLMYSILNGPSGPYAQVIDVETGRALWSSRLAVSADLTASVWRGLLLFTGTGGPNYELFAFDGRTGKERWSISIAQRPVNLIVDEDRAFVLGSGNLVVAIDLETQQELWQTDLSAFDPDWEPYGGMNRYGYFNDGRLALTNGVLAVLISNGRIIALDADDGSQEWMAGHSDDGRATVHVIAGHFVITAEGKSIFDMDDDPYLQPPSPVPSYDPKTQPCERTVEPLSATDSSALGDYETSATSLDPITGEPSWKVRTHAAVWLTAPNDTRLVAMIRPGWDAAIGNEDFPIYCSIDGETGDVARISDVQLATFTYGVGQTDESWGMGIVSSGVPFGIGHLSPDVMKGLPHIELDPETFTGFRWVQEADGLILITEQNGTVIGFPENAPDRSTVESTPAIATPAADTGWIAHGPDGITDYAEVGIDHVIADGRIFRAFNMKTGGPHVQAIDTASGDVLWDVEIESGGDLMVGAGDLLLVAAPSGFLDSRLVALDMATGREVWTATLSDLPVAIVADGKRVLVLGVGDKLDGIDLETGQTMYAVDIRGEAKNVNPYELTKVNSFADYPTHRMAIDDKTLYATLADGSVVAVDPETGSGKWWSLRATPGVTQIYVIAGDLVVVDNGDVDAISAQIDEEIDATRSGTPLPSTPIPMGAPSCALRPVTSTPAADSTLPGAIITTYQGLDKKSGEVRWSTTLPAQTFGSVSLDDGVLYEVWAISRWQADRADVAVCVVDARTGQIRPIDSLDKLPGRIVLFKRNSDPETWSIGMFLENEQLIAIPAAFDPEVTGPVITLDETFSNGWQWNEVYEDSIYISMLNGDLVKIPIPAE